MRPKSISRFEGLALVSVALGAVAAFMTSGGSIPGADGRGNAGTLMIAATVISIVVSLVLILLSSRKASNVAKWILILLVAASAAMALPRLGGIGSAGTAGALDVASVILQVVAIFFLFTAEARAWFDGRGSAEAPRT